MMHRLSAAFATLTPEQIEGLNTTTAKHILGTRLVVGTSLVCAAIFVDASLDGGDRSLRLALGVLDSYLIFLAALLGINTAQFGIKRATDREMRVQVAQAKAQGAPPTVVAGNVGTVDASGQGLNTAERAAMYSPTTEHAAPRQRPTGDARLDDESGS